MSTTFSIVSLEGSSNGVAVTVQFNPKELSIDKSVVWQQQKKKGPTDLAFTAAEPKTMSFELMFDTLESGPPIQVEISKLDLLSSVDSSLKRPPKVRVLFGAEGAGMLPPFDGVIESVSVKYTMFAEDGAPVRAVVNLELKEAGRLVVGKP